MLLDFAEVSVGLFLITGSLLAVPQQGLPTDGAWSAEFDLPGLTGRVFGLGTFGGDLIAGGDGFAADGNYTQHIARFDGATWSPMGGGFSAPFTTGSSDVIRDVAEYGGDLYACGSFYGAGGSAIVGIARWDGTQWNEVGGGLELSYAVIPTVFALAVFQGELYAAGEFNLAGGQPIVAIARWDGSIWRDVGGSFNANPVPTPRALLATSTDLYVAGMFSTVGGTAASNIARFDGAQWHSMGAGIGAGVHALEIHGGEVIAGGVFQTAGGNSAEKLARWDGTSWRPLGGIPDTSALNYVNALESLGSDLYIGGFFHQAGSATSRSIVRFAGTDLDQSAFVSMGGVWGSGNATQVLALTTWNGRLIVGGEFSRGGGYPSVPGASVVSQSVLAWNGNGWESVGRGLGCDEISCTVLAYDGGIVVGGSFLEAGGEYAPGLAYYDGSEMKLMGDISGAVRDAVVWQGDLVICGTFTSIDGQSVSRVARYDGVDWNTMGAGFSVGFDPTVLATYAGDLYAGGAGSPKRWTGAAWVDIGNNIFGQTLAMKEHNGLLYIGGSFNVFSWSTGPRNIAVWNGSTIGTVGGGLDDGVYAFASEGSDLLVGGEFSGEVGGVSTGPLARFNGSSWSMRALVTGTKVSVLAIMRGELYAGGDLIAGIDDPRDGLARLNGGTWEALDGGILGEPQDLHVDGGKGGLWVAGLMLRADGRPSHNLARWVLDDADIGESFCFGVVQCPCGNNGSSNTAGGCVNSSGREAVLSAGGYPSLAEDSLCFEVVDATPGSFGLLTSADNQLGQPSGTGISAFDGLRCIGGSLRRHGVRAITAAGSSLSPWAGGGLNAGLLTQSGAAAGATRHWQVFYRELAGSGCLTGQNSTNAVSIMILP